MPYDFLKQIDHRPWPLPCRRWNLFQSWQNLLFAHYRIPAESIRDQIPAGLTLQEYDGSAWLGIVPFYLVIRPRYSPSIPGLSFFPEINVRTYVERDGKPGVWFFSLDATSRFAVWAARKFFSLPYHHARIDFEKKDETIRFAGQRLDPNDGTVQFQGTYGPGERIGFAEPGTLEHFLTERYCLYAVNKSNRLIRLDVHHEPWPLQTATATIEANTMTAPIGVDLSDQEPILHYAERIDVVCWPIERLS